MQTCQAAGKKVLLSVKGDGIGAVGGNADYGDPNTTGLGPVFGGGFGGGIVKEKRQDVGVGKPWGIDVPVMDLPGPSEILVDPAADNAEPSPRPFIISPPDIPLGPGPVIINETETGPVFNESTPVLNFTDSTPTSYTTQTLIPPTTRPFPTPSAHSITPFPASNPDTPSPEHPNLFDSSHTPSAFALTLSSLFGTTHTERADLRPLGPDTPSESSPDSIHWRPLGEEVIVDGFDVQLPAEWEGTYQDGQFKAFVDSLKSLEQESWEDGGGVEGGPNDLGSDGKGVVVFGWIGGGLRKRDEIEAGWVEWNGGEI